MVGAALPVDLDDFARVDFRDALPIEAAKLIRPAEAAYRSKDSNEQDNQRRGEPRRHAYPFCHRRRHHTTPPNPNTLNGNSTSTVRKMARIWLCVRMISFWA